MTNKMTHQQTINATWNKKPGKMDYSGMEYALVEILKDDSLTDEEKVNLSKECINAFTRRGYFE